MRFLSFVFLFIFSLNIAAQSPTVSKLFSDGTKRAGEGQFNEALRHYKTALIIAKNEYLEAGYLARLHYNVGVCYFRLDQFELAVSEFKSALLLKKDYVRAHYALGMAQMRKRNWKGATVSFSKVAELDPKNGEAWFDRAFAMLAVGDINAAEAAFVRSIALGSIDSALSHNNIGVILAMKGDLGRAETQFANAIAFSADRLPEAKRNLEFCRAQRYGKRELVAKLEYATRAAGPRFG